MSNLFLKADSAYQLSKTVQLCLFGTTHFRGVEGWGRIDFQFCEPQFLAPPLGGSTPGFPKQLNTVFVKAKTNDSIISNYFIVISPG